MFIGYAYHSVAYRFIVFKSEVLDCYTVIETKNAEFFENIFPLSEKISHTPTISNNIENTNEVLRKSKQQRKNLPFGNDFYSYIVDSDPLTYSNVVSSLDALFLERSN